MSNFADAIISIDSAAKALHAFYTGKLSDTLMADIMSETFGIKNPATKAALLAGHLELWDVK